jgi:ATP:ADP antiporter, AAA family
VKFNAFRFLNVKPEEQAQVALMLVMGFFIGIFVATYQVTSESLFLNSLSGELNKAFFISGGLGIAFTLIFSFFQNRIRFVALAVASMTLIFFGTAALHYFYHFGTDSLHKNVLILMYCLSGPMIAILLLCYWGIFGRLFDFKQSKRIIGWIDTGQLIAIILANFLIPLSASLFPDTSDYLLVCDISLVGAIACLLFITIRYSHGKFKVGVVSAAIRKETSFANIFRDKYVLLLSVFLVVSVVTLNFNQFVFQTILNKQYTSQRDLTNFLAYFNGVIYLLSLFMQTFLNDKILSTYGIRTSLIILPILSGALALVSFLCGAIFGYDLVANSSAFVYFFLFVALTRLFNSMIRDSLENPVFKLMFVPLDSHVRFGTQAKVEGVVSESGRLIAGGCIFLFSLVPFFKILWIPAMVVGLCVLYYFVIQKLYAGYKNKIRSKLENIDYAQDKLELGYKQIAKRLESKLLERSTSKAVFSFKLLEKIEPAHVGTWINALMKNVQEDAKDFAQRRMNEVKGLSVSDQYVIRADRDVQENTTKKMLTSFDLQALITNGGDITKQRIKTLARSAEANDRQYAAELLLHSSNDESISYLIELLSDLETKVRKTAISTAIKVHNTEVIYALIDNLPNPVFSNQTINALVLIGGKALAPLENAFYRSGQNTQTVMRIIQVIGRIGGQRAKELLWSKIDYPDKVVVSQVLVSLGECGFKAGTSQITRIKYAIESDIADIAWNLNAMEVISSNQENERLNVALIQEDLHDIDHIYMLLAMLYDTRSIQLVKENIESGTSEGVTYAIELLDVFLSEQLKVKIIPVLDDISNAEKVNRLEIFFPRMKLDEKLALKFLINRDFTQSNRWTKVCALEEIGKRKIVDFKLDLIAHLFNPDRLIREMAGWALYQIDEEEYHRNVTRLDEVSKRWLDRCIISNQQIQLRLFQKVIFFQSLPLFDGVSGVALSFLADISKEQRLRADESLSIDEKINNDFFIVYSGSVQYYDKSRYVADFGKGQFVGEMVSSAGFANSNLIITKEESILLKINKDQFYELLADNVKLADKFLEYV